MTTSMTLLALTAVFLAGTAAAQPPPPQPLPSPADASALGRAFWGGLDRIGVVFKAMGSLSGGAVQGEVWAFDLATGERRRLGSSADLSWPVGGAAGGEAFALRGRQLVRITAGGGETPVNAEADWRKLLGVLADGTVVGFVIASPRARPALVSPAGAMTLLAAPETEIDRARAALALQEDRDYADGSRLEVRRSERGGRGFDIFLVQSGSAKNLTDCGDDNCGQPSLNPADRTVLYIRASRR